MPSGRAAAAFLGAWAGLNALVQLSCPGDDIRLRDLLSPSQELFAAMWVLCLSAWLGLRFRRGVAASLAGFMIFTAVFRTADRLVPRYFDREFNLFIDGRFLPDLLSLLYDTTAPGRFFAWSAAAAAGAVAAFAIFYHGFRWIQKFLGEPRNRTLFLAGANLLLTLCLGCVLFCPPGGGRLFSPGVWPRIAEEIGFILTVEKTRRHQLALLETAVKRAARLPSALDRLEGRDVYLIFVESYGETLFENPRHFETIAPVLRRLSANPRFSAASRYLRSPTVSGSSWLAHGTLAGGVMTDSHLKFNLLLASRVKPLAHYFNAAGYRTVGVMPGTKTPRPEDRWFAFQQTYDANNLGYRGPAYGWATMPDQFVLDALCRKEIRNAASPLFIQFVLVSSHAAFHIQPQYLEDWSRVGDGAIFHELETRTFPVVWPDLANASEAFAAAIAYDLSVIEGFLNHCLRRESLVIVMGDHQPSPQITGEGRSRSVPVHVISQSPDLLQPFLKRGYTPGFIPAQPPPHPGMDTFLEAFLEDFSSR